MLVVAGGAGEASGLVGWVAGQATARTGIVLAGGAGSVHEVASEGALRASGGRKDRGGGTVGVVLEREGVGAEGLVDGQDVWGGASSAGGSTIVRDAIGNGG